jgi:hypothetical protein
LFLVDESDVFFVFEARGEWRKAIDAGSVLDKVDGINVVGKEA